MSKRAEKNFWSHPVSRTWDGTAGQAIEILCFANGDEPRLTCGGEEIPLTRDEENGYWVAVTPPRPAPLVLEARRGRPGRRARRARAERRRGADRRGGVAGACGCRAPVRRCRPRGRWRRPDRVHAARRARRGGPRRAGSSPPRSRAASCSGSRTATSATTRPTRRSGRRTLDGRVIVFVRPTGPATVRLSAPGLPDVRVECGR